MLGLVLMAQGSPWSIPWDVALPQAMFLVLAGTVTTRPAGPLGPVCAPAAALWHSPSSQTQRGRADPPRSSNQRIGDVGTAVLLPRASSASSVCACRMLARQPATVGKKDKRS